MQSNPPVSLGRECMSGMRGPSESFPLHCFSNRPSLSGEAIQLRCWALPVCMCLCICVCVCSYCLARPRPVFQATILLSSPLYLLNVFSFSLTISAPPHLYSNKVVSVVKCTMTACFPAARMLLRPSYLLV